MKKFIALLLAAVMCFSLAACGGNGTQQGTSENGGEEINSTDGNSTQQENGKIEGLDVDISYLYGEWDGYKNKDGLREYTGETFTFNEDGTCIYEGNTYPVKYKENWGDNTFIFALLESGKEVHCFQTTYDKDLFEYRIVFAELDEDGYYHYDYESYDTKWYRKQEDIDLSYICGKWIGDTDGAEPVIIKEDRVCTIDEQDYTWYLAYNYNPDNLAVMYVYEEAKRVYDSVDVPKYKIEIESIEGTSEYQMTLGKIESYYGNGGMTCSIICDNYKLSAE